MKKKKLITQTRNFWQQRTDEEVTDEDARQIIENVTGFFWLLREWEIADRENAQSSPEQETS